MFDKILGHQKILTQLFSLYQEKRLASTLLFHGPESVGKATAAKALAAAILDDSSALPNAMHYMTSGTHPNFFILSPEDGKKEITVERSRELLNFLKGTPALPGYRIALVDSADQLGRQAANALLKMLEEPPAQTLIILLAHQLGRVLPTILSRATKIALKPLPNAEMKTLFPDLTDDLIDLIAGCPGKAHSLHADDVKQSLQHTGKAFMLALNKNYASLQSHLESLDDIAQAQILSLIPHFMKRILLTATDKQSEGIRTLLQKHSHAEFSDTYHAFEDYVNAATIAYLPLKDILYGSILVLTHPKMVQMLKLKQL